MIQCVFLRTIRCYGPPCSIGAEHFNPVNVATWPNHELYIEVQLSPPASSVRYAYQIWPRVYEFSVSSLRAFLLYRCTTAPSNPSQSPALQREQFAPSFTAHFFYGF